MNDIRTAAEQPQPEAVAGWREHCETALKALSSAVSVYDVQLVDRARAGLRAMLAAAPTDDERGELPPLPASTAAWADDPDHRMSDPGDPMRRWTGDYTSDDMRAYARAAIDAALAARRA